MIKKIITIFLAFIFLFSALTSCSDIPSEDSTPETSAPVPEETKENIEEPVLKSLCAKTLGSIYGGYVKLIPEEGSKEAEKWEILQAGSFIDGSLCPILYGGERVAVVYSGEIETTTDPVYGYEYGYINDVHSIQLKPYQREYGGVQYGIAVMREGFSRSIIKEIEINAGKEDMGWDMLLLTNREKLTGMIDNYFLFKRTIPEKESDIAKENIARINRRDILLNGYNSDFFNANDLLMIIIHIGSGGLQYDVPDITIESGICTVHVDISGLSTDSVDDWIIFVSIPKGTSKSITEYKTYTTPEWYN